MPPRATEPLTFRISCSGEGSEARSRPPGLQPEDLGDLDLQKRPLSSMSPIIQVNLYGDVSRAMGVLTTRREAMQGTWAYVPRRRASLAHSSTSSSLRLWMPSGTGRLQRRPRSCNRFHDPHVNNGEQLRRLGTASQALHYLLLVSLDYTIHHYLAERHGAIKC